MAEGSDAKGSHKLIVACRVMQEELEAAAAGLALELVFLDQGLHRTPDKMTDLIQEQIDTAEGRMVVLVYGLCSNGLAGVRAGAGGLVAPRCHDCIALFMGSPANYLRRFDQRPGTYYLTPGWVREGKDPLSILQNEYIPRLGRENAEWAMREELKHYSHICMINTTVGDLEATRARTRENCAYLDKQYEEIQGSLGYFRRLLRGPYQDYDFITLAPDKEITQGLYF